jgi:hypothetical protein
MDEIWVPCEFNVETFAASGVARQKLVKIPEAVDVDLFRTDVAAMPIPGRRGSISYRYSSGVVAKDGTCCCELSSRSSGPLRTALSS